MIFIFLVIEKSRKIRFGKEWSPRLVVKAEFRWPAGAWFGRRRILRHAGSARRRRSPAGDIPRAQSASAAGTCGPRGQRSQS